MFKVKSRFVVVVVIVLVMCCFTYSNALAAYMDTEHWAKNYINYVTEQGHFYGMSTTEFAPNDNMSRAMFVTVLARYTDVESGSYSDNPFKDVSSDKYYFHAVAWAYENHLIQGRTDTLFCPDDNITREEAAVILADYFGVFRSVPIEICDASDYFNDVSLASSWAIFAINVMGITNTFSGDENGNFRPLDNITRAECAVIFSRMDDKTFDNYKVPVKETVTYLSGKASAYSESLVGGLTASGERLSSTAYTVAVPISQYKTYAGRHVEITYNGITIIAKCNDCGGFEKYGRVLDLSPGCFKAFGYSTSNSWGVKTVQYRWID